MAMLKRYSDFKHEPLDTTQRSIRLISVDPQLSQEGLIQCTIHHATINAVYNCLSYRWGSADSWYTLVINGQRFSVNQNLHEFLEAMRTFDSRKPGRPSKLLLRDNLWIDAVCIDQRSTEERNHQVAQMGKIYTNAEKVIMWLGTPPTTSQREISNPAIWRHMNFIFYNEYWTRAWITQEVVLAKDPVMMVANQIIPFPEWVHYHWSPSLLRKKWRDVRMKLSRQSPPPSGFEASGVLWAWMQMRSGLTGDVRESSIINWLYELRKVECGLLQDRIFSLLELTDEGDRIPVDYTMPLVELVYHVLLASKREICLCQVAQFGRFVPFSVEELDPLVPCWYVQWENSSHWCRNALLTDVVIKELISDYEIWDDTLGTSHYLAPAELTLIKAFGTEANLRKIEFAKPYQLGKCLLELRVDRFAVHAIWLRKGDCMLLHPVWDIKASVIKLSAGL
ncbi:hypothetical protein OPT61_g857 [Boeremia exigua]|uniref:Uncharacterized protein n=1 Tax=Boeremia exigua TaxID=749465 RepID=A0ACC2IS78_9PLEO|nr:hypothetical protein OPT61_g857 [Boeremia exigua]